jgi:hypothetical protein
LGWPRLWRQRSRRSSGDTDDVLRELGLDDEELIGLKIAGAIS